MKHYILGSPTKTRDAAYKYIVRVLFEKQGKEWIPVHSLPIQENDWFVAFDGKCLGKINNGTKLVISGTNNSYYELQDNPNIPHVKPMTTNFNGWMEGGNVPLFRPLVLVTKQNYTDPQNWKPFNPIDSIIDRCILSFRKTIGSVVFCDSIHGDKPTSDYNRSTIITGKCYHSNEGEILISLYLNYKLFKCEVSETGGTKWFLFDKHGKMQLLNIPGSDLLDAGDYDSDGLSELIFSSGGYNKDGYLLLYDSLKKQVENNWSYH